MTQQEFEQRVGMSVNATEYASIENVYMASDLDKDAFCILWEKMNFKRVARAREERVAKLKEQMKKEQLFDILNKPYGKNEFGTLVDNFYSKSEKAVLESIGIHMQQERNGIPYFVSVASVLVDLRKYLKVA